MHSFELARLVEGSGDEVGMQDSDDSGPVLSQQPVAVTKTIANNPCTNFCRKWRNVVGFFILGLVNNYPFVIMLSAAFDIISRLEGGEHQHIEANETNFSSYNDSCTSLFNSTTDITSFKPREKCQRQGTSVILLADVLPTLIIKLTAPYWMQFFPYWIKVFGVVLFSTSSFLLVALSTVEAVVLVGVACASISSGFGEAVLLSLTAHYDKSTVTAWASGTGAAGVAGALAYAALKSFLSPKVTLLVQVCIPFVLMVAYLFILGPRIQHQQQHPQEVRSDSNNSEEDKQEESNENLAQLTCSDAVTVVSPLIQTQSQPAEQHGWCKNVRVFNKEEVAMWWSHVKNVPRLFKYMLPLFVVYFAEYAINQGFFELLYNPNTHIGSYCLDQKTQYRWLQVVYQVGVLISRTSVSVIYVKHFWIFSLLQLANFVFFFFASVYLFLPSFLLTCLMVLYEGLLGGAVYVNAFYTISKEVPVAHREFSMGVASVADSLGITSAGVASIYIHSFICRRFIGFTL